MPPINDQTSAESAPAQVAETAAAGTMGAGHAEPVVDESATKTSGPVAGVAPGEGPVDATANPGTAPVATPGAPPAQAGDPGETHVAEAKPVLLPTVEAGQAELDANPARSSVLTDAGHLVRN